RIIAPRLSVYGIPLPVRDDLFDPLAPWVARVCDPRWWRLRVRRLQGRELEQIARALRLVNGRRQVYAADFTVKRRAEQQARNRALLTERLAVNDEGQEYTLQELADLSVSNPEIRRCELMVRIAGFEQVAKARG